jgi:hypothetical protein
VIGDDAQAMTILLKPGFAPIEQYSDDPRFRQGPWTDIYAMAAVFYFAVTGRPPPASASRVMRDSVAPLADARPAGFSVPFLQAIDRGLSLQPDDRPRSIAEFRAALWADELPDTTAVVAPAPRAERVTGHAGSHAISAITAPSPTEPVRAGTSRPSRLLPLVGGALAAVAVTIVGWMALESGDPPVRPAAHGALMQARTPEVATDQAAASAPSAAVTPQAAGRDAVAPAAQEPTTVAASAPTEPMKATPASTPISTPVQTKAPAAAAAAHPAASEAKASAPANGTLRLAVKPWAEIRVGGVKKGVSPPLKDLALPAGRHTIELRNPAAAPVTRVIDVQPGRAVTITHQF